MIIIWGSTGRSKRIGGGEFFCPDCRKRRAYEHTRLSRYFTLFFIPLFPFKRVGEFVTCARCRANFDAQLLDYSEDQIKASVAPWKCRACGNSNRSSDLECLSCQTPRAGKPVPLLRGGPAEAAAQPEVSGKGSPAPRAPQAAQTSVLAIISLVIGLLSPLLVCACYLSFLTAPVAIVTGHLSRFEIRRAAGALGGSGLALTGLISGYLSLALSFGAMLSMPMLRDVLDRDTKRAPGELALREAEAKIVTTGRGIAQGNTPQAQELANRFATLMKRLDAENFTDSGAAVKPLDGNYVAWCELRNGTCAFVVHVPEYRRFEKDAKEELSEMAWQTAQVAVQGTVAPGSRLAVGLKGDLLFGDIMVGAVVEPGQIDASVPLQRDLDESELYAFFTGDDHRGPPVLAQQVPAGVQPSELRPPAVKFRPGVPPLPGAPPPGEIAGEALPNIPPPPFVPRPRDGEVPAAPGSAGRTRSRRPETLEQAVALLETNDAASRGRALSWLRRNPPEAPNQEVADKVLAVLNEGHPDTDAYSVVIALAEWATPEQLPGLAKHVAHENTLVQMQVIEIISGFKTAEAAAVLAPLLADEDHRNNVSYPLQTMGSVAEEAVLQQLPGADQETALQVVRLLGDIGTGKSIEAVSSLEKSPVVVVSITAKTALNQIRAREARQ